MDKISPYYKAILGFLTPGVVVIGASVTAGSDGGSAITTAEWVTALVACFVTGGVVFRVGNKDPQGQHQAESVQPAEWIEQGEV